MTTTTTPAANTASPTTSTSNPTPAAPTASNGGKLERIAEGLNNVVTSLGNTASVAGEGAKLRWRALESYIHDNQDYIKLIWLYMPFIFLGWIIFWELLAMFWAIYPGPKAAMEIVGYGIPALYFLVVWYLPNNVLLALAGAVTEALDNITGRDDFNVERARKAIRDRIRIMILICGAGLALRPFAPTWEALFYMLLPFGVATMAKDWASDEDHRLSVSQMVAMIGNPLARSTAGGAYWTRMFLTAAQGLLLIGFGWFAVMPYMTNHFVECRKPTEDSWFAKKDNKYSKFFADTSASGWKMETMVMPGVSTMGATIASTVEGTLKTSLDGHLYLKDELGVSGPTQHIRRCFTLTRQKFDPVTSPLGMKLMEPSLDKDCKDIMAINEVTIGDVERVAMDKNCWERDGNAFKEACLKNLSSNAHTQAIIRSNLKVVTDPACWIGTNNNVPDYCTNAIARRPMTTIVKPGFALFDWDTWDGFSVRCLFFKCDTLMMEAHDTRVSKDLASMTFGIPISRVPVDVAMRARQFADAAKAEAKDINYAMCTNHPAYDSFNIADWEDKAPNAVKNERDWNEEAKTNPALQSVQASLAKVKAIEAGPSALSPHGAPAKVAKAWGADFRDNNAWWWFVGGLALVAILLKLLFGGGQKKGIAIVATMEATEKLSQMFSEQAGATSGKGGGHAGGGDSHAKPHAAPKPKGGGDAHAPH